MPSAPRERKPLLVVLALLLILVGAGAAGLLVQRMTNQIGVIEVVTQVNQGQHFTQTDLTEVMIPSDSSFPYATWDQVSAVTDSKNTAAVTVPKGTLLTPAMVVPGSSNLVGGRDTIGLSLKDGQYPPEIQIGDTVEVYSTASTTNNPCASTGKILATGATVLQIAPGSGNSGNTDVEIAVDPQSAYGVVCETANGDAGIAVTSANGAG